MECPCCHQQIDGNEFLVHVFEEHPEFFIVLQSFATPFQALFLQELDVEYFDRIFQTQNAPPIDDYEELLQICEMLGTVKIGVPKEKQEQIWKHEKECECPICIETVNTSVRLNKCGHSFCKSCIETWFEENKKCPICKTEVID